MNSAHRILIVLLLGFVQQVSAQFFYGTYMEFGKNRVQFTDFDWNVYRLDQLDVYYYANDRVLPRKVALMTQKNISSLQRQLETSFDGRVQVILFTTLTDLKQSNLIPIDDIPFNTGGVTQIAGSKIYLYFDGNYQALEQRLRKALAELMITYIMYGDLTESIRNSTLLNLPDWYLDGLVSYLSTPWSVEIDREMREGIYNRRFKRFNSLTGDQAEIAGHALWHFVAETYGKSVIRNILYMTLVNRNVETGFQYILGIEMGQLLKNLQAYYRGQYQQMIENDNVEGEELKRSRKTREFAHIASTSNGKYIAYSEHNLNEFRVYVYDVENNKRKRIYKGGYKIAIYPDRSFPIMDWHPNNRLLAFMTEEKGYIWLYYYDTEKKKLDKRPFYGVDKVHQFQYSPDGRQFVMSAVKNGQSNIYLYNILSTSYQPLTSDDYIDLWPSFINGGRDIVFTSDRPDEKLVPGKRVDRFNRAQNVFIYKLSEGPEQTLRRVTNTSNVSEVSPSEWKPGYLHYIRRYNGVRNDFLVVMDSNIAYVDTITHYNYTFESYPISDLDRNIEHATLGGDNMFYVVKRKKRYRIFKTPRGNPSSYFSDASIPEVEVRDVQIKEDMEDLGLRYVSVPDISYEIDISNYQFDEDVLRDMGLHQDQIKEREKKIKDQRPVLSSRTIEEPTTQESFEMPPRRNYFLSFYQDELTFQFDNTFLNPQYQPFTGRADVGMLNPGFNGLLRVGVTDLLNDYKVTLAARTNFTPLPGTSISPNHEIFVGFHNYKRRLNQETFLYRRSHLNVMSFAEIERFFSHEVMHQLTYPLSPVKALQLSGAVRMDHQVSLSREQISLQEPADFQYFGVMRAAYIYDNVRTLGINLWEGTRYKLFTEYYRRLDESSSGMHTLGIDVRKYNTVHGPIIWANRLASGTSFGQEKLIHFLGGVDNQFAPQINEATPIAFEENYIFQTLATNMRGFFQNARNGNNFAVFNSELRIPLFRYLMKRPILNEFVNNFQVVPFFDVGTAWNGFNPYGEQNAINSQVIDRGNIRVVIDSNKEPIIAGTGVGLRTKLFGYFVRVDWAKGIEDGVFLPRVFHISIGTDF
ncbi:MAG: hypothetical protein LAT54_03160 [Cryomorphaceae bacterium]|nr:hypothetical protein [Cryomorphaceae bacterium]